MGPAAWNKTEIKLIDWLIDWLMQEVLVLSFPKQQTAHNRLINRMISCLISYRQRIMWRQCCWNWRERTPVDCHRYVRSASARCLSLGPACGVPPVKLPSPLARQATADAHPVHRRHTSPPTRSSVDGRCPQPRGHDCAWPSQSSEVHRCPVSAGGRVDTTRRLIRSCHVGSTRSRRGRRDDSYNKLLQFTHWARCSHLMCLCSPSSITWYLARAFMLKAPYCWQRHRAQWTRGVL